MKGKLIPVEEEGLLEDAIQDEVVQNGTTDDLIAMLRRQQPSEQEVDLLGMLRNGNSQLYSQMSSHPTEPFLQGGMSYMFQQSGNGQQGSDLMEFSPKIEPTRDSVQPPPPPPPINPTGPVNQARQESLLNILKGGAPKTIPETKPSNPSPLDILKSPQPRPLAPASPPKSQHQQNLLSMLKSLQLSSTTPPIQNIPPLSSVETQRTDPRSHPKSPPARPTLPSTESHQHALLATLKSNPNPPQSPPSKPLPASAVSSHQNSLLSALKSPKLETQTNHKTSLLAALNNPPPPSNSSPTHVSTTPSETARTHQTATSSLLAGTSPPVPRATPTPAHQTSLLSALKSPTLQAAPSTLPAPPTAHTTSLLSAFKNPPTAPSPVEKQGRGKSVEKPTGEVKNVHMESLLKTLKSPSTSPVLEKITPKDMTSEVPSAQTNGQRIAMAVPVAKGAKEETEAPKVGQAATGSDRVNSLLSALKGPSGQVRSDAPQSPAAKNDKSVVTKHKNKPPTAPEPNSSTKPSVPSLTPATVVKTPPSKVTSLLDTLKGKSTAPTSPPTPPTARQKSLLSVLNPSSPRTLSPPSKPSPKPQQFNFSPTPQVGKRIKFRETLVAGGGIREFQPERKTNGNAIDLGKVTLLRRPTPEPAAPPAETTPEGAGTENEEAKQTEMGAVTDVREDSPPRKQSVTGKDSVSAREVTPEPRLSLPTTAELSQSNADNVGTIHTETGAITVLKRPESLKTESTPLENKPESPLGIEFPFRRRTPSKGSRGSPTPTTTPTRAHSQSLLALLKGPPAEVQKEEDVNEGPDVELEDNNNVMSLDSVEPSEAVEGRVQEEETEESKENLGTEREMKLIAMLERALSRGLRS